MTMWFNHHFRGAALTVEYGSHPSRRRMVVEAPRQVLGVLGAYRTSRG
jgi:protein MpaA